MSTKQISATRKLNHTASERRRRERINVCYQNLSSLVLEQDQNEANITKLELLERAIEFIKDMKRRKSRDDGIVGKKVNKMDIRFIVVGCSY